jgi:hypothetical protein
MASIAFDTLKFANTLRKAGLSQEQAEVHVAAYTAVLSEVLEANRQDVATKGDIAEVKSDIAAVKSDIALLRQEMIQLEQRMTIKLGTMLAATVGWSMALAKLLFF